MGSDARTEEMHRRVPRQSYQKKRPLSQIAKQVCDDGTKSLDTKAVYQDPYALDEKEDNTDNWDGSRHGKEKRALFDSMMSDFSERVQASARRQSNDAQGGNTREDNIVHKGVEREVCDKIECALKPFFMKHVAGGGIKLCSEQILAEFCRVLGRCGVKQNNLSNLLTGCAKQATALAYLPCVSTTYVRVTVALKIETGVVKQFVIENGWRKESAFAQQ